MKIRSMSLVVLVLGSILNAGCTPAKQPITSTPASSLRIDQPVYNFGTVTQGKMVTHDFTFTNTGPDKLVITHVQTTCSCTVAMVSSKEFLPGASGKIRVTFDSKGYLGNVTKTITVIDNDPVKPASEFTITGEVITDIMSDKPELFFGSIKKGSEKRQDLSVSIANPAVHITAVTSTNPSVRVSIASASAAQKIVRVTVTPNAGYGPLNAFVAVFSTSKEHPVLLIPLIGNIVGDILVNPDTVDFGVVRRGGEYREISVYLYTQPEQAFSITGITAVPGIVEIKPVQQNSGSYKLLVTLKKTKTIGTLQGVITVRTTLKAMPVVTIPYRATIAQ